jgi:branched-chain amino acid transport system permease protein
VYLASIVGVNVILAVSLNIVNGMTGQFSIGHAGFMAVGAYTAGKLSLLIKDVAISGLPGVVSDQVQFVGTLLAGGLAAAVCGFIVGLPSLRLRGDYLAIVTLGFGEIIRVVILNIQAVGGARGFVGIPGSTSAFLIVLILVLCVLATHRFIFSSHGRALLAVRENEVAAEAMGVNTTKFKVGIFVISSAVTAVGGGLFAHYQRFIEPGTFDFMKSVDIVIMVVLGGMGSISGSIVAAFLITLLPEALRPLQNWTGVDLRMVLYSLALILMMMLRPKGLFGRKELWEMFGRKTVGKS